jgi:hypothetical protein
LPLTIKDSSIDVDAGTTYVGTVSTLYGLEATHMKRVLMLILIWLFTVPVQARQSNSNQQSEVMQVQCRDMASTGDYLAPNETLINGKACRPIPQAASTTPATPRQDAETAPVPARVADPPEPATTQPAPAAALAPVSSPAPLADGKTRVFVTDSQSWETRGGSSAGGNENGWGASSWIAGGARPQTAEIIKTLNERCPEITVTNNLQKADFVLTLDHEGGKGMLAHRNKVAVFNRDGDDVFSASTRELGNSVKDACTAMLNSKK